jgi:hypothetical protein
MENKKEYPYYTQSPDGNATYAINQVSYIVYHDEYEAYIKRTTELPKEAYDYPEIEPSEFRGILMMTKIAMGI